MYILGKALFFPPVTDTGPDGMYAIGGDLSPERLLLAYRKGIFPWYNEGEPICWYCPDPRFVLFPPELKVSKSMKTVMNKNVFSFTINMAFTGVIENCRTINRKDQPGSWISASIVEAYSLLHTLGYAHSAEAWYEGELAGGLYGIRIGKVFFGESMFSRHTNASKFAFVNYVRHLQDEGVKLIDCQVYTNHLSSLGARMMQRNHFLQLLESLID